MTFFITILRAISTCLITNAHYKGVYPTDLIAKGGLGMIGNFLFLAISGYCLANIKTDFYQWYRKRIIRCFVPMAIITVFFLIASRFYEPIQYLYSFDPEVHTYFSDYYGLTINSLNAVPFMFIYPTLYHFVSTIALLYIPYYFIAKYAKTKEQLSLVIIIVSLMTALVYSFAYDTTYFHIESPREQLLRWFFFISMLIGLWCRRNEEEFLNKFKPSFAVGVIILIPVNMALKLVLEVKENTPDICRFQILLPVAALLLVYFLFRLMMSFEGKLNKASGKTRRVIQFLADRTLDIYLVQAPVIIFVVQATSKLKSTLNPSNPLLSLFVRFNFFPLNWIVLTGLILIFASILGFVSEKVIKLEAICYKKVSSSFYKRKEKN